MAELWRDAPLVGGEDWRSAPLVDAGRFDQAADPTAAQAEPMAALPGGSTLQTFLDAAQRHDYLANLQSDLEARAAARRVRDSTAGPYDYAQVALKTGQRMVGGAAQFLAHAPSMILHTPEVVTKAGAKIGTVAEGDDEASRKVRVGGDTLGFDMSIPAEGTTGAALGDFIQELLLVSGAAKPVKGGAGSVIGGELPKAEPFFSKLEKTIEEAPTAKAPAAQWKSTLANAAGVKAEEIDWTGVNDWLTAQEASGATVTREALLGEVQSHRVQLGESLKGEDKPTPFAVYKGEEKVSPEFDTPQEARRWGTNEGLQGHHGYSVRQLPIPTEFSGPTRFHQYQLPGGTNYKELVVTMPAKGLPEEAVLAEAKTRALLSTGRKWEALLPAEREQLVAHTRQMLSHNRTLVDPNDIYRSTHWPGETNPLVHMRFNDRVDAQGHKTLFIEEIQSDWHQQGREKGYNKPREVRYDEHGRLLPYAPELSGGVPDAPFKKSWPELALKRMIRWATDHGYDQIAWTPGHVQAERYDLSKHVSKITYRKASPEAKGGVLSAWGKGGERVIDAKVLDDDAQLADHIGKEAANKLLKTPLESEPAVSGRAPPHSNLKLPPPSPRPPEHRLEGLDLKVGGEGMHGFYDRMLPSIANKLVKKHGVKVDTTEISTPSPITDIDEAMGAMGGTLSEAAKAKAEPLTVHRLKLPESLKEEASKGFTLFANKGSKEGAALAAAAGHLPRAELDPSRPVYLRVGDWNPERPISRNYAKGDIEAGLSVYELDEGRKPITPAEGEWAAEDLSDRLRGKEPKYLVQGDVVGQGHDGEPLLGNPRVVDLYANKGSKEGKALAVAAGRKPESHPAWIPQRLPTSVKAAPETGPMLVDVATMKRTPELFDKSADLIRDYPNSPVRLKNAPAEKVVKAFQDHIVGNLLDLYDRVSPEIRNRSKLWYVGGRAIIDRWSKEYDLPDHSVAGAIAAMSPQKDWYKNVSVAHRVIDTVVKHSDDKFTAEMERKFNEIESFTANPAYVQMMADLRGKSLNDINTMDIPDAKKPIYKAMWVRLYDEAHREQGHRLVTPEGNFGELVTTKEGEVSGTGWGSLVEIGKAVRSIEAKDDAKLLSKIMGERHKVRNFFNNLISPFSKHGDVTIDTHAVAAGLVRPLSGNTTEVAHNLATSPPKGVPGAPGSAETGIQGLYPIYADAYREAAKARGVLPREMQSITWEAIRGLFPREWKTKANVVKVDAIWNRFRSGKLTQAQARELIYDIAGGISPPSWFGK